MRVEEMCKGLFVRIDEKLNLCAMLLKLVAIYCERVQVFYDGLITLCLSKFSLKISVIL